MHKMENIEDIGRMRIYDGIEVYETLDGMSI
jgi:hypothetical protein